MATATMAARAAAVSSTATTRGAIVIDDVVKIYDPDGAAVMAVDHCSLDIAAGEICMIVGPSGCGKTTLLNAIAGFHEITSGQILLDGEVLCSAEKPKAEPSSDRIVVFQNGALFPWKTNLENVAFGPLMQGKLGKTDAFEKARAMMADAGLAGVEHNYPGEVSSGMRRRVEIVRALMNEPKVLLLDEPASGLDPRARIEIRELLKELHKMGKTIVISSHILPELAELCSTVGIIERGELLYSGPWTDIVKQAKVGTILHVGVAAHERELAAALLAQNPNVENVAANNGFLEVSLKSGVEDYTFVPHSLIAAGYHLTLLKEEEVNLETAFMRLTKGMVQ